MKALFSVFKEQGIQYQYDRDFNGDHQFHAILKSTWREGKKISCFLMYDIDLSNATIFRFTNIQKKRRTQPMQLVVNVESTTKLLIEKSGKRLSMTLYL